MSILRKRPVVIGAAAVAAAGLGVAGVSIAASGGSTDRPDPSADLAKALSAQTGQTITADQVKAAHKAMLKSRLDAEVAAGRLTRAQADAMLERADQGPPPFGGPGMRRGGRGGMDSAIAAVAKAMDVTPAQLRALLRDGDETLAEEAAKKGVSRDEVVAAIAAALQKAPASLPAAQAKQAAERIADGACGAGRPGGRGGRGGAGFGGPGFGPPPGDLGPPPGADRRGGGGQATTPQYGTQS